MNEDRIVLSAMAFYGYHGVLDEERRDGQIFVVTIDVGVDLRRAGETDELEATVDYRGLYDAAQAAVEGPPRRLLEAVADQIATAALANARVQDVCVEIRKPHVKLGGALDYAAVRIVRRRTAP